jgi:hypothetical protein
MPVLYSVVARGPSVLAKHASCTGNFEEVTEQILSKIPPHNDKMTYLQGPYLFHYICEDRIVYMCITDDVSIKYLIFSVAKYNIKLFIQKIMILKYAKNIDNNFLIFFYI